MTPKTINNIIATNCKCLSLSCDDKILPKKIAILVQSMCPKIHPKVTKTGDFDVANKIVATCERSPHSAINVKIQHWIKSGDIKVNVRER